MTDFVLEYQALDDDQILSIAADRNNLLDEARMALDMEMHRRGLTSASVAEYQTHVEHAAIQFEIGSRVFIRRWGLGKRFRGKKRRVADETTGWEEFDSTLWMMVFWVPLFPVGTYRVRRQKQWSFRTMILKGFSWQYYPFQVIQKHTRDWGQIFLTWVLFLVSLTLIVAALVFVLSHF